MWGAGIGTRNMVFLTFGTGMGAGLILNGSLYRGDTTSSCRNQLAGLLNRSPDLADKLQQAVPCIPLTVEKSGTLFRRRSGRTKSPARAFQTVEHGRAYGVRIICLNLPYTLPCFTFLC